MNPAEASALAALRAVFAEPVVYTGAGLDAASIRAIKSEVPADSFEGFNGKGRRVSFEIEAPLLPEPARKSNTILHDGTLWQVIDINPRPDVGAVVLFVEEAAA
jgi:hypothetical protein